MVAFIVGALVGAMMAVSVLGFLAVIAEERENEARAQKQREKDRARALQEMINHYRGYD